VQPFIDILKEFGRISSLSFVLTVFGIGVALLSTRRFARLGKRWIMLATVGLWFMATPVGSAIVAAPLSAGQRRIESPDQAPGTQAIVVLGGGISTYVAGDYSLDDLDGSALRVIEGARLYKLLDEPLVVVSGGTPRTRYRPRPEAIAMRAAMVTLGVPSSRIVLEDQSRTTHDEAVILKSMFDERRIERFVLVTSPTHMTRSMATFRAVGLNPIPSVSALRSESTRSFWTPLPDWDSLAVSDVAIYDAVAWVYYWRQGWLKIR
jgi:uncharacterized SAM-binding protein YcdF (DUF218 family)